MPKAAELAAFGLTPEDYTAADDNPVVWVWPENWPVVALFDALATQWRMGPSGPSGLDYTAIEPVLRLQGIAQEKWGDMFASVQMMEIEALDQMRLNNEERSEGGNWHG